MSLQVITNILNDYLSLEQDDKEVVLQLLLDTEDEDVVCPCCAMEELLEEASIGNQQVASQRVASGGCAETEAPTPAPYKSEALPSTNFDHLWDSYINSLTSKGVGVARF